ncbi:uncharacterized protein LOC129583113 [Paramacrobiotus metropolitanus]|uniref:uncharacterized protein LOC129583113 n=1 Tax=Paramacrobiotus metropolitanus TaxID=2943436 RepID=UPI00244573C5|nr:uncharacterized protein LOC129583113 [Paramacrobiotus metropolitanus]
MRTTVAVFVAVLALGRTTESVPTGRHEKAGGMRAAQPELERETPIIDEDWSDMVGEMLIDTDWTVGFSCSSFKYLSSSQGFDFTKMAVMVREILEGIFEGYEWNVVVAAELGVRISSTILKFPVSHVKLRHGKSLGRQLGNSAGIIGCFSR